MLLPNNTLQSSLEAGSGSSTSSNAYNAKGGCADIIRTMLREQKKECAALHAHPLFREFRNDKKHARDRAVEQGPPVIDDLEAEGQSRLLGVIKSAAQEHCHMPVGVWASFGSPYACLGTPVELDSSLPTASRHSSHDQAPQAGQLASCSGSGSTSGAMKAARHAASTSIASSRGQNHSIASTSPAAVAAAAAAAASAASAGLTAAPNQQLGTAVISEAEAVQLLRHKFVLSSSTLDKVEASFPEGPMKQAKGRRLATRTKGGTYYSKSAAAADAADAAGSYGWQPQAVHTKPGLEVLHAQLAAVAGLGSGSHHSTLDGSRAAGCHSTTGDPGRVFITQRPDLAGSSSHNGQGLSTEASQAGGGRSPSKSNSTRQLPAATATVSLSHTQGLSSSTATCSTAALMAAAAAAATAAGPAAGDGPVVHHLRALTDQKPGEHNPVIDWHNRHLQVRQTERAKLQHQLWQRAEGRASARTQAEAGAVLSQVVESTVAATGGLATAAPKTGSVASPFQRTQHILATTTASTLRAAAERGRPSQRSLKPQELALLQQFYESLCVLVERQRLSDPLSLLLVHKVKALLEEGVFLHRPLLQQVVDHVADFALSCGLVRYNPFALPLLTFIRKCTGVTAQELHGMAANAGITPVLYPPRAAGAAITCASQEAATIAAALAAAACDAGAEGSSATGSCSPGLGATMLSRPGTAGDGMAGTAAGLGSSMGADTAAGTALSGSLTGTAGVGDGTTSDMHPAADAAAISAAAEAAQQQLVEAIASARQSAAGRAGTASSSSSSLRAKRVPGVAGSSGGAVPRRPGSAVSFAEPAGAAAVAVKQPSAAGGVDRDSDDEPLPDLGGEPAVGRAKVDLAAAAAEWKAPVPAT